MKMHGFLGSKGRLRARLCEFRTFCKNMNFKKNTRNLKITFSLERYACFRGSRFSRYKRATRVFGSVVLKSAVLLSVFDDLQGDYVKRIV